MTRKQGVTVELLDYDLLAAACIEHHISAPAYMENGLLRRLDGGAAVIVSSEGVGSRKITLGMVYLDTDAFKWQCLPLAAVEACRTGVNEDLSTHIRTFGSRLDGNHYEWFTWANEVTR